MPHVVRVALLVLAAAALGVPVASQQATQGRRLTIEDYYRVKTVGGATLAPGGRWVAYTVSTRVEDDNGTKTETWIAPSDASTAPRRIQHEGTDVSGPRWTDDDRLQYVVERQNVPGARSSRGTVEQWRIDPADPSAAPERVDSPAPVQGGGRGGRGGGTPGVRSPDGRWIALAIDKPQPTPQAAYASDFEQRHQERFKGAIFDWKDFQRDGAPFPAPDPTALPAQQIVIRAPADGTTTVLVDMDLRPSGLAWHPNGQQLAFVADSGWRNALKYSRADLWMVTTDRQVTRLTDDAYVYSDVHFSPTGKYLSYVRTFGTDMIIDRKLSHGGPRDIYIRPVAGGEPLNLTANWDLDPGDTRWSPDGRYIYFSAGIGGESHLFRVPVPAGRVEQVTRGPRRLNAIGYDRAMAKIVYTVGLHEAPADVYVADIDGTNERKLSDIHRDLLSEIAFSRAERLRWPSDDGTHIEGWLMFPYGYDPAKGPYPMIVTSHGGPHSATGYRFDFKDQYFAANGYFVLDTNFRSSTGYGDAFKWATWGAWGTKDGQDVVSGVDYVMKRYPIDPKRVGHIGHSYGGFMTNWLITRYPDRFAAAISGAGISNWISDYGTADIYRTKETEFFGTPWEARARDIMIRQSPLTHAGRVKTPTLFVHGEVDQRVPYEEGEQMYFALKRRGVPARMIQYQGQPHGIGGHWNNVHRMLNELAWWDEYLKPRRRPKTSSQRPN